LTPTKGVSISKEKVRVVRSITTAPIPDVKPYECNVSINRLQSAYL